MEWIHHLHNHSVRPGRWHTFYSAGSCKLLLNNQGLIDRKRIRCHFAGATVINTFFILYMLQGIIVLLAPNPSLVQWICFKMVVSRMLATQHSPRGTKHKNNRLISSRNTSNYNMAGIHSEERQSQRGKSTDGWIGGTGGDKGTPAEEQKHYVRHTESLVCTREIYRCDEDDSRTWRDLGGRSYN